MKKLPEFTLVHQRWKPSAKTAGGRDQSTSLDRLSMAAPSVWLRPGARLSTRKKLKRGWSTPSRPRVKTVSVGIWDVGAYVGRLPRVIEDLNDAQRKFVFYEAVAAIPAGTVSEPRRLRAWSEKHGGSRRLPGLEKNVIAEDFFKRAALVRRDLGLGYLAGITRFMIADEDDEQVYWNLFSVLRSRLILVSSYDLRKYAEKANRPFEAAVLALIVADLIAAWSPRLEFHEDRGCLFDFNRERAGVVKVLRNLEIEPSCLALIPASGHGTAVALVETLRHYSGGAAR